MAIILDADVIIRGERGAFDLEAWLRSRPSDLFQVAAVAVAELWHGVERATGSRKMRRRQYLEAVLAPLPVLPYTDQTALEHARIWAQLEAAGTRIGAHDLILAATALEHGHDVATFNPRHFRLVPGLTVIEPR